MTKYLLDANIFIQAKNQQYGMDFCPAFWEWLVKRNAANQVYSIQAVGKELTRGEDELSEWAAERGDVFFLPHDQSTIDSMPIVSGWVNSQQYKPQAVAQFLGIADCYLIACAHAHGYTIVTHEIKSDGTNKIKIPNVCTGLNVKVVSPYVMLREEKAKFLLG